MQVRQHIAALTLDQAFLHDPVQMVGFDFFGVHLDRQADLGGLRGKGAQVVQVRGDLFQPGGAVFNHITDHRLSVFGIDGMWNQRGNVDQFARSEYVGAGTADDMADAEKEG